MTDPTLPIDPGEPLEPDASFAGHRIEEVIGTGGMGIVYRARNLMLQRERALKLIAPALSADERFRARFRREVRLAAQVEHPSVIAVHDAGEEDGQLYFSMRLVEGPDMRHLVEAEGPLDPERAVRVLGEVASGLDAAHARGLVHRDVKPGNVLVEGEGEDERAFIGDFGISRIATAGETLTEAGDFFGSPDYVAPEQIEGEPVDPRTDAYALGGVLHFMLTGQPPFPRDSALAKLFAHTNAPPPRPSKLSPGLPSAIDRVIAKAMAKRPEDRYRSAGELAAAAGEALGVPAAAAAGLARRPAPSRRAPYVVAAAAGALAVAALAVSVATGVLSTSDDGDGSSAFTLKRVDTIKVGERPTAVSVGPINVWVASSGARRVYAINPASDRVASEVPVPGRPRSVAPAFHSTWTVVTKADTLYRLDPGQGNRLRRIRVGDRPSAVAAGGRFMWVAHEGASTVSRINPVRNTVSAEAKVGEGPRSIATGSGAVWVVSAGGSLSKLDPVKGRVVGRPIRLGGRTTDVAVGEGSVWVTDRESGTLIPIHPVTLAVGEPIAVGDDPRAVATGLGYVWVADGEGTVVRVDPETRKQNGSIRVGAKPVDVTVGKQAVWTANEDDATVTRIGR